MKTITLFVLFLEISGTIALAQSDDCTAQCYPFKLCDGIKLDAICTSNPWTVSKGGQLLIPFRPASIPVAFCEYVSELYFMSGNTIVDFIARGQDGHYHVVFDIDSQMDDYIAAMLAWSTICPPRGGNPDCCINIIYSIDPQDFTDTEEGFDVFNIAGTMDMVEDKSLCQPECLPQPRIIVNISNQWLFLNDNAPPGLPWDSFKRMFYTGATPPGSVVARGKLEMISLRELITHELGHYYGLAHPGAALESTSECAHKCLKDDNASGAMVGWKANIDARGPSEKEICAFKKINCPDEVLYVADVPGVADASIQLYPNVLTSKNDVVIVKIAASRYDEVLVQMYDAIGNVITSITFEMHGLTPFYIPLSTEQLLPGIYFVRSTLSRKNVGNSLEIYAPLVVIR